ncbi:glycosyltransferase family 2 protein [Agrilactobacillus fermenti]|uniref:glycosyltransferase family 2 protein n=1 Tax=Agrilactobacillus fermenti TaxID=2586909 RepID=UPI003A5B9CD6
MENKTKLMKEPLVSIIVPVYNVQSYLQQCITSLKNQDYSNYEVIIVDDGSTDNSRQILKNEVTDLSNFVLILESENHGQAYARNIGLDKAKGDYILFVDSDDYVREDFVKSSVAAIVEDDVDVVVFNIVNVTDKGSRSTKWGTTLDTASTSSVNKIYRKRLWENERFLEDYWYEDLGTIPIVMAKAQHVAYLDEDLYYYHSKNQNSQTHTKDFTRFFDIKPMCDHVYARMDELGILKEKINEVENLYIEHYIVNSILRRFTTVRDRKSRNTIIEFFITDLTKKFPNWRVVMYRHKGTSNKLKYYISMLYIKGYYHLADFIWLGPKRIADFLRRA